MTSRWTLYRLESSPPPRLPQFQISFKCQGPYKGAKHKKSDFNLQSSVSHVLLWWARLRLKDELCLSPITGTGWDSWDTKLVICMVTLKVFFGLVDFLEWRDRTEHITRSEPCPQLRTLSRELRNWLQFCTPRISCELQFSLLGWVSFCVLPHVLNHSSQSKCPFTRTGCFWSHWTRS